MPHFKISTTASSICEVQSNSICRIIEPETFCTTLNCKSGRAKAVYVDWFLMREKFIIFECLHVIYYNTFCNRLYYLKSEQFSTKLLKVHSKSAACERHTGRIDFLREQNKYFNFPIWSRTHLKHIKLKHSQLSPEYISHCLLLSSIHLGLLSQSTVCTTAYSKQNAYWSDNIYIGVV